MVTIKNPYVGPRSFRRDTEEAKLFFGREQESQDLLVRVLSERLTIFYAQSGAGKSSLINARLIPSLEERGIVVLPVGRVSGDLPPGLGSVENIFLFNLMDHIDDVDHKPQRYSGVTLSHFLQRLTSEDGRHFRYEPDLEVDAEEPVEAVPYVLIIDQFEEIVTAHTDRWQERAGFFRDLDAAMRADPNLSVVLSLREDFVPSIEPYAPLMADRMRARFYMQRMQERQALEAVQNPVKVRGKEFAPEAAQALVDNLRQIQTGRESAALGQYVEPVQLQVVCFQLWESLGLSEQETITLADLERVAGGRSLAEFVNQALREFYERVLREVLSDPAVKSIDEVSESSLRRWVDQHLITELGTRSFVYQGERQTAGMPNLVLRLLRDRYLLRAENRAGGLWYELVHDRFVEPIRESNRAWLARNQKPLTRAAQAWDQADRPPTLLLSGVRVQEAQAELAADPADYGALERAFVAAGDELARQASTRRLRQIVTGAALLVFLFAILAGWGFYNADNAARAQETAEAEAARARDAEATAYTDRNLALAARSTSEAAEGVARSSAAEAAAALVAERTSAAASQADTIELSRAQARLAAQEANVADARRTAEAEAEEARTARETVFGLADNLANVLTALAATPVVPDAPILIGTPLPEAGTRVPGDLATPAPADLQATATIQAVQAQLASIQATQTTVAPPSTESPDPSQPETPAPSTAFRWICLNPETATSGELSLANFWNQHGELISEIADELGIDPAVAVAVVLTESAGNGFGADGRLLIRFEAHMFYDFWGKTSPDLFAQHFRFDESQRWRDHQWRPDPQEEWRAYHGSQESEWQAFELARSLDETAALQSISMGAPQLMGFNYARAGYPSVQAMFEAFQQGEGEQIRGLFQAIQSQRLTEVLQDQDFFAFSTGYNGPGQAEFYATLMRSNLEAFERILAQQPYAKELLAGLVLSQPFIGNYRISQFFGENPQFYRQFSFDGVALCGHTGLDFAMPVGATVVATDSGVVDRVGFEAGGFGNFIRIKHDWGESIYAQLSETEVAEGQAVLREEPIGKSGNSGASTGPHLSFDIRIFPYVRGDGWGGFSDPLPYLQEALAAR